MFPRGFSNLQQYITFEWTIVSPRETLSLQQTIQFLSKYYASNVHFNQQYQFLFISKEMEVLGGSSYFYFIPPDESSSIRKEIYNEQPSTVQPPGTFRTTPQPCASSVVMSAAQKKQAQLQRQHHLKSHHSFDTKITSHSEEYRARKNELWRNMSLQEENPTTSNQHCCPQCKQPKNSVDACEKLVAQVKSAAEHARTLETKLLEVEQALEMSQVARKVLQLAAHHAKRERMAYQKFLNELIMSLSEKGTVRIILAQGTEMLLKRVTDEAQEATPKKTCPQESFLKAIIGSQEQTIRDLQAQLECTNLTTGCPTAQPIMTNIEIDPEADLHPCIKETVDLHAADNNDDKMNKTYSIDESVTMRNKKQQVLKELSQVLTRRRIAYEQQSEADWWSENRRELDPTTVMVKGDFAKFAIIRF
ncbi:uncharacterized protein [Anabrus simplex]